jgi:hypothetical protein
VGREHEGPGARAAAGPIRAPRRVVANPFKSTRNRRLGRRVRGPDRAGPLDHLGRQHALDAYTIVGMMTEAEYDPRLRARLSELLGSTLRPGSNGHVLERGLYSVGVNP